MLQTTDWLGRIVVCLFERWRKGESSGSRDMLEIIGGKSVLCVCEGEGEIWKQGHKETKTKWDAREWTWDGYMQGKCPTLYTITLALKCYLKIK